MAIYDLDNILSQLGRRLGLELSFDDAIFTDTVKLPVFDELTGQTFLVTFEPREVIIQRGSANSGHYYMYTKQQNGEWLKHDDDKVTAAQIKQGEQAKFISFQVVGKEVVKAKDDIMF